MKVIILFACMLMLAAACTSKAQMIENKDQDATLRQAKKTKSSIETISKTPAEWKEQLSDQEYYVLREAGTERSFSGEYWDNKKDGVYTCKACDLPLFDAQTKFKSGTGWPSYYEPIKSENVIEDTDYKIGYARTEVLCARCSGHLGHVFDDGPRPTGLRYCINSVSLKFVDRTPVAKE